MKIVPFEELHDCDLIVDAVYEGSSDGKLAGEPISNLLPGGGNMGGFRIAGKGQDKQFVVLFTTSEDKDWPDRIDLNTGQFTYYGDNKTSGHELHDTPKGGNLVFRRVFELIHSSTNHRHLVPPFFVFNKSPTAKSSRAVQFKGLAVPGFPGMSVTEDLVAVWKTTKGQRFQNYRSVFTILNVPVVPRTWLKHLMKGESSLKDAPQVWKQWVDKGHYSSLVSEPTTVIRTEQEQMPDTPLKRAVLDAIWQHFHSDDKEEKKRRAFLFESFAARIFQMHDQRVIVDEITRGVLDRGRDAYGRYLLGLSDDPVYAEFSLEAKCYRPPLNGEKPNTVGVKEVSRLISRIRHRQFGVLVTTSVVARQAYEEVREDRHPIIFICGKDICEILINNGYNSPELVKNLLTSEYSI
ncbi:MAG: restriction endonuclease [Candidatus Thiodiazotropha lotti]|nr:restriction endonuclease [Candidatus Thiodiazotropha lotti]MCW4222422.1 restriction endonuclease [Candidatus Thiodiazotropha lotti]